MSGDKRDECGCHKGCITLPHDCDKKCEWPNCLTEAEHAELAASVAKDFTVCERCDRIVSDCELWGCGTSDAEIQRRLPAYRAEVDRLMKEAP